MINEGGDDDSPLLQTWLIIESRGIGRARRYEVTPNGLTIGRNARADIIVLSTTVNEHHATIEWDNLREHYFIRDLNTRNGTFINQQPLRGTTKQIERGDSLRFGYDTDQSFRVEVLKDKTLYQPFTTHKIDTPPHTEKTTSTAPTISTTVPIISTTVPTISTTVPTISTTVPIISTTVPIISTTVPIISTVPSIITTPVNYVPILNQTGQTFIAPLSATVSPVHQTGVILAPTATMATMVPIATVSQIITTQSTIDTQPSATNIKSTTSTESVSDIHKDILRVRIDGRKSVPSITRGSPLYGVPSWWGEEGSNGEAETEPVRQKKKVSKKVVPIMDEDNQMPFSDSELIPRKIGSKILREIDNSSPRQTRRTKIGSHKRGTDTSGSSLGDNVLYEGENCCHSQDELSMKSSCHGINEPRLLNEGSTTFIIEFEEGVKKRTKPPQFNTKRPASYTSGLYKEQSPAIVKKVTTVTPYRTKGTNSVKGAGVKLAKRSIRKPPSGNTVSVPSTVPSVPSTNSTVSVPSTVSYTPAINNTEETFLISQSNTSLQQDVPTIMPQFVPVLHSHSEIFPPTKAHSQPNSLHGTPYAMSEPAGSRPGSARRQWSIGGNEIPYSLIMASIETRMRRLSENAQNTLQNVRLAVDTAKKEGLTLDGQGMVSVDVNTELPLWKLVNTEYQHISKYILEVERALKDINKQIVGKCDNIEQVDYTSDEHSIEYIMVDSIEEEKSELIIEEESEESNCEEAIRIEKIQLEYENEAIRTDENQDSDGYESEADENEYYENDRDPDYDGYENEADGTEDIMIERNLDYDGDNDSSDEEYFSVSSDHED